MYKRIRNVNFNVNGNGPYSNTVSIGRINLKKTGNSLTS